MKESSQRNDIKDIYGKLFGFYLLNENLTANDFTDFVLGAGRVNAEKFMEKILEYYII